MSAPIPVPSGSIIRATTTFEFANIFCQHKWYFQTVPDVDFLANLGSYVMNVLVVEKLMTRMVNAIRLISVSVALVSAEVFTETTLFPHDPTYGAIPELGASPIVANVWQLRTGKAGRRGRGRILIFGFPQAYVEDYRHLSDVGYNSLRALADSWENTLSYVANPPMLIGGVFSRKDFASSGDPSTSFHALQFINTHKRLTSCSKRRN